jgi:tetrahydromethanopterin S-methyltransferase subunit A
MMSIRKKFDDAAGKVCEIVLPIKHEYYVGRGKELAICTLSSIRLLEQISKSEIMDKVALAGRLLSENKGIDSIIQFTLVHPSLERIIVCGQEVKGHKAGQALLSLYKNGIDENGRIIGATGQYPILKSSIRDVEAFRKQVAIMNMVGIVDLERITELVA